MQSQVRTIVEAITLRTRDDDFTEALTDNYLKMKIPGRWRANRWMAVEATELSAREQCLIAAPIHNTQATSDSSEAPETQPILTGLPGGSG
jgi:hypothetical protein